MFRLASSRYIQAIVTKVVSGDTVELVAYSDGSAWGDGDPASLGAKVYDSVAMGSGVGEWLPGTIVSAAVAAGTSGLASTSYVDTATAGLATEAYVDSASSGYVVVPAVGTTTTLALGTARRPSTTRPTRVNAYGQIALSSTLLGAKSATVTLLSDSANPPTTSRGAQQFDLSGVVANVSPPWRLSYDVPTGHYYMLVASGPDAAGVSIQPVNETAL